MPEEIETGEIEAEAPEAPAAEVPEVDPFDTDTDKFERPYVEKVRNQAAEYRTKLKPYEDTFSHFNDDEKRIVLDLAKNLGTNPEAAAAWMKDYLERVEQAYKAGEPTPEPTAPPADQDRPLTLKEYQSLREAEAKSSAEAKAMNDVIAEVKSLGLDPDSDDWAVRSDAIAVMQIAAEKTGGDLKAAHAMLEARNQKIIDSFLEKKKGDAGVPSNGSGGIPSNERKIGNLKDAKAAALERLSNM